MRANFKSGFSIVIIYRITVKFLELGIEKKSWA